MLETRIARRYLWAARKERHTAFLSLISMLGLAVGVACCSEDDFFAHSLN